MILCVLFSFDLAVNQSINQANFKKVKFGFYSFVKRLVGPSSILVEEHSFWRYHHRFEIRSFGIIIIIWSLGILFMSVMSEGPLLSQRQFSVTVFR